MPVSMFKRNEKKRTKKPQPAPAPPDPVLNNASETPEDSHTEASVPVHTKRKKRGRKGTR